MTVKRLYPLKPDQARAADPAGHAWVAASAGTGKTQVLAARVLRLLLDGARPEGLLCVTFTKAAAAEMQERVFGRLACWAVCPDADLAADLAALHVRDIDAAMLVRARRLFAAVLDAPGGLAVQTIHAFAQSLLASFPLEAGVSPGFATLDDRTASAERRRLLAHAIDTAAGAGDTAFLTDIGEISVASGEAGLTALAGQLGRAGALLSGFSDDAVMALVERQFGLASGMTVAQAQAMTLALLDVALVERLARTQELHGGTNAKKCAVKLRAWLASTDRAAGLAGLHRAFTTEDGRLSSQMFVKAMTAADPGLYEACGVLAADLAAGLKLCARIEAAADAARRLRVGLRLARDWAAWKRRAGVIDFDDMIAAAARLLTADGAAEWVRFKLNQRIDHLLVDEAQDTNDPQWRMVEKLTEEFFAGAGARDMLRTLFVVGDFKQSIYSFQGARPGIYRDKRDTFQQFAEDARQDWREVPLATNFRSTAAVLDVVDTVVGFLGHEQLGARDPVPPHTPHRSEAAGRVTLWPPVGIEADDGDDEEAVATAANFVLARNIAAAIAAWLDPVAPLVNPATGRAVQPQDILVLLRKRDLAQPIISALHDRGVPVAGIDRLKLTDPLAVGDLLALVRFALQPDDDLTLAEILTSPFGGIDHDRLFALAHGRDRASLWSRLRDSADPALAGVRGFLETLLGLADFSAPYEFFETILSTTIAGATGRARLLARLGEEARDAIDAVLAQALDYERAHAPSLQGFLAWLEAEDVEIKRDPDAPLGAVRLMTIHGAKGLQAPVVILADAAAGYGTGNGPVAVDVPDLGELPMHVRSRKTWIGDASPVGQAIDAADKAAREEHWRLLYVALTRAEDMLFVGGAFGRGGKLPDGNWHEVIAGALRGLGASAITEARWQGETLVHARGTPTLQPEPSVLATGPAGALPVWATTPAPVEARPPRPLSPSAIAADDVAQAPMGPEAAAAARRGQAMHRLFERLPAIAPARRAAVARGWLAVEEPTLDAEAVVATVMAVLDDPRFAGLFGPDALAEAPVAARVGEQVIAGTVDRLLVTPERVLVVDFKTGRRVPAGADAAPVFHLRQMAAYVAALERIFPGRPVVAALLYTEAARLIELPAGLLAAYAPGPMR